MISISHGDKNIATFEQDGQKCLLNYHDKTLVNSISLSLPNTKKIYTWEQKFPPYFETFIPEGYLYEIFKNILTKQYGYIDDYLIFSLLASNIQSRVKFKSDKESLNLPAFDIDEILNNDTPDTFTSLLNTFLDKNSISGVQPKTIAIIKDKDTFGTKEFIVKTWGDEYPNLAENEYHCLRAVEKAGVVVPKVYLSKNKRFLLVEKFIYAKDKTILGFEEVLSLMDKNRTNKYQGSYEQVAKCIYPFLTDKKSSMTNLFKTIVMNYLLKNGDAHLKNFGLLFSDDFSRIWFAPAYDIVTTTTYIFKDKPALTLGGKKVWCAKDELVKFGMKSCFLSKSEALSCYQDCEDALRESIANLKEYIKKNPKFSNIGNKMLDCWKISLKNETIKEISDDVIKSWKKY